MKFDLHSQISLIESELFHRALTSGDQTADAGQDFVLFPLTVIFKGVDANGELMLLQANPTTDHTGKKVWQKKPKTNLKRVGKAMIDTWRMVPELKKTLTDFEEDFKDQTLHLMCIRDNTDDLNWVIALVSCINTSSREESATFSRNNYRASGVGPMESRYWDCRQYYLYCDGQNQKWMISVIPETVPQTRPDDTHSATHETREAGLFDGPASKIAELESKIENIESRLEALEIIALELSK